MLKKILSLSILLFLISGCSDINANNVSKLRIGYFPNINHSQALVGIADGSFQKALGTTQVEWKMFNSGPSEVEALLVGEIDIGYIGPGPAINGYAKSEGELQIIAGASRAGAILVSKKDLIIKDLKELSGKKVAIPQYGNTQDLILRKILIENGLTDSTRGGTVEIVQAKNADIKMLLDKGDIDAAFAPEPWGSLLIKEVEANVVLDFNEVMNDGNYTSTVVIVRKDFANKNPELIKKFLKTHIDITESINGDLASKMDTVNVQLKILTKKTLKKDILRNAFTRVKVTYDPEIKSLEDFIDISYTLKYLKKPNLDGLYNLNLLNEVLLEKGLPKISN